MLLRFLVQSMSATCRPEPKLLQEKRADTTHTRALHKTFPLHNQPHTQGNKERKQTRKATSNPANPNKSGSTVRRRQSSQQDQQAWASTSADLRKHMRTQVLKKSISGTHVEP